MLNSLWKSLILFLKESKWITARIHRIFVSLSPLKICSKEDASMLRFLSNDSCCFCRISIELLWSIAYSKVCRVWRNWPASKLTSAITASLPTNADVFTPRSLNVKQPSFIKSKYHSWEENWWNSNSTTKGPCCVQLITIAKWTDSFNVAVRRSQFLVFSAV